MREAGGEGEIENVMRGRDKCEIMRASRKRHGASGSSDAEKNQSDERSKRKFSQWQGEGVCST
eukprot:768093-Hanusia_phi.AAC.1